MKMNIDALKALELKLAEYAKANGTISEHESSNSNCHSFCASNCSGYCKGTMKTVRLLPRSLPWSLRWLLSVRVHRNWHQDRYVRNEGY